MHQLAVHLCNWLLSTAVVPPSFKGGGVETKSRKAKLETGHTASTVPMSHLLFAKIEQMYGILRRGNYVRGCVVWNKPIRIHATVHCIDAKKNLPVQLAGEVTCRNWGLGRAGYKCTNGGAT
jgi:hypothetical protein